MAFQSAVNLQGGWGAQRCTAIRLGLCLASPASLTGLLAAQTGIVSGGWAGIGFEWYWPRTGIQGGVSGRSGAGPGVCFDLGASARVFFWRWIVFGCFGATRATHQQDERGA